MDFRIPFRGSGAVASGLLSRAVLVGPRFRRLFPDVYVSADAGPDLALRSLAALVVVGDEGVLGGYSAAEVLGASCGRDRARRAARAGAAGAGRSLRAVRRVIASSRTS